MSNASLDEDPIAICGTSNRSGGDVYLDLHDGRKGRSYGDLIAGQLPQLTQLVSETCARMVADIQNGKVW